MIRWVIIFLAFGPAAFSQRLIEGKIVDAETGMPIAFASVSIIGTSRGTSSNQNGEFTLSMTESISLKITCIGYESVEVHGANGNQLIQMKPIATLLKGVVVFTKPVNPKKIVRKAFANIHQNYEQKPFLQKFFYRHYCKDDSAYGRLIEAFVDVWKNDGYQSIQKSAGEDEAIRISQLRRSLDKTTFAEGHEPIAITNILQADIVGYQPREHSEHMSFYSEVSNLKTDIDSYTFTFEGITTYDGQEVYEISYKYKQDSALLTSGKYMQLTTASGLLYITTDTHAFVKTEDVKQFSGSTVRSSAFYRKQNNYYYPYHLVREGENQVAGNGIHSFHIDLTSFETKTDAREKFSGSPPGKEELGSIPYDSNFWNGNSVLKTTPLENKIIRDLGEGLSLNNQFLLYRQYELNTHDGGINGVEKFKWFREYSKGKRILYLFFWSNDCRKYIVDLEMTKQLQKKYRGKIAFVLLSLEDDETEWQKMVSKYALYSDGILNYRIGKDSKELKSFNINGVPSFVLISKSGEVFDAHAKHPFDPMIEKDFKSLLGSPR